MQKGKPRSLFCPRMDLHLHLFIHTNDTRGSGRGKSSRDGIIKMLGINLLRLRRILEQVIHISLLGGEKLNDINRSILKQDEQFCKVKENLRLKLQDGRMFFYAEREAKVTFLSPIGPASSYNNNTILGHPIRSTVTTASGRTYHLSMTDQTRASEAVSKYIRFFS